MNNKDLNPFRVLDNLLWVLFVLWLVLEVLKGGC